MKWNNTGCAVPGTCTAAVTKKVWSVPLLVLTDQNTITIIAYYVTVCIALFFIKKFNC